MPAYSPFLTGILNQQPAQQTGQNLAALSAIQPYLTGQPNPQTSIPAIPQYGGVVSNSGLANSLMGRAAQPQQGGAAQPGTAGTSLLNNPQLLGLLQQLMKNQNANTPANTPSNNYYYGLSGGQGNPSMYGGAYAGMGAPT